MIKGGGSQKLTNRRNERRKPNLTPLTSLFGQLIEVTNGDGDLAPSTPPQPCYALLTRAACCTPLLANGAAGEGPATHVSGVDGAMIDKLGRKNYHVIRKLLN